MDRQRIEQLATYLAVRQLVAGVALATLAMADGFLDWDLLDGRTEKVAELTLASLAVAAVAAMAISLMVNVSLLASSLRRAVERIDPGVRAGEELVP